MFDQNIVDRVWWVSALQIDAPDLKRNLMEVAVVIDSGFDPVTPGDIAPSIRKAFEELSKHTYYHCRAELENQGSATEANARFDQFEKLVAKRSKAKQGHLHGLRGMFQATGNLAVHPEQLTMQDVIKAFNRIAEYAKLWIECYAPNGHRKTSALKDPYLDAIAEYRKRAQAKLTELMEDAPADCYLERKFRFRSLRNRDEPQPDEDPYGLDADTEEHVESKAALDGMPTSAPLKTHRRSLFLAQAGMGKSLEAAQLAVRLTCIDGIGPLGCCVVLACRDLEKPAIPEEGYFISISPDDNEKFWTFCALRGWKRYLILDGLWWSNLKRHNDRFFSNLNGGRSEKSEIPKNL